MVIPSIPGAPPLRLTASQAAVAFFGVTTSSISSSCVAFFPVPATGLSSALHLATLAAVPPLLGRVVASGSWPRLPRPGVSDGFREVDQVVL